MSRWVLQAAVVVALANAFAPVPFPLALRGSSMRSTKLPLSKLRASTPTDDGAKKSWQDVAEKLADPFISPLEKPGLAQELIELRGDVVSSLNKVKNRTNTFSFLAWLCLQSRQTYALSTVCGYHIHCGSSTWYLIVADVVFSKLCTPPQAHTGPDATLSFSQVVSTKTSSSAFCSA